MKEKVFLDIETTSLDADTGIIVAIGLGFENKGTEILFVNAHEEEENILVNTFSKISEKQVVKHVQDVLLAPYEEKVIFESSDYKVIGLISEVCVGQYV